ncbi:hypothetical protein J422_05414 [Methanocaldococcus villosus KIN24-T80]|uniref:Uncharacterized protein n=1 Tax=Methanocaldococcus villosus KIN24-T80 TaxID=1069083 RepID=N6VRU0_9EURY|nr:hypothetical protein [Methanocaldococcus villosus]ENN95881.1 hypothetical protein J422_05414 [Methanocaldococcus villosus KIN24-T80]
MELKLPPGLPQSIIARVIEFCNVNYDIREDPALGVKYPVLIGDEESLEKAKEYLKLITELKLALRDIARLARKHKIKAKVYAEDENIRELLKIIKNDIANREFVEVVDEKIEGEVIEVLDKKLIVG